MRGWRQRIGGHEEAIELVIIRTTGDIIQDRPLAEDGGKGLFTKEIEEALLDKRGRCRGAFGERYADRFAEQAGTGRVPGARGPARCLHQPQGQVRSPSCRRARRLGTASLRRQALAKRMRPDLQVMPFRGNVETRLRKLDDGEVDATLLALAGLETARTGRSMPQRS